LNDAFHGFIVFSLSKKVNNCYNIPMPEKAEKTKKLSTEPYKGVRDFYPGRMAVQNYIFDIWKKTAESFGYEEYGASVLEPSDLYKAKSGEEIVNEQTYTFIDRGDREVTLRPEMTPTLARMVAAKKRELVFPLRWYSIPNLFRYEQPQRGRVREHWQLNVDLFGVDGIEADIEVISLASQVMKNFGAKDGDFVIKISNREWLDKWFEWLALELGDDFKTQANKEQLFRLLDIKDKDPKRFAVGLKKIRSDLTPNIILGKEIDWDAIEKNLNVKAKSLTSKLKAVGINNAIIDLTGVVRGFDYYTGIVFEIYDTNPENRRALFGGGRYDDLTSLFGGDKIPAVGFGMGDVTIRDWLLTRNLLPEIKAPADYYICVMSEAEAAFAENKAQELRDKGSRVAVDFTYKKIGDQIKSADKRGIPNIIVIGPEEVKSGKVKVKNLASGEEKDVAF
jgi:histidyl-tRNA synthetase